MTEPHCASDLTLGRLLPQVCALVCFVIGVITCAVLKDWVSGGPRALHPAACQHMEMLSPIEGSPLTCLLLSQFGILTLLTGCAGVLGLASKWSRALRAFMLLAWLTTGLAIVQLALLGTRHPDNIAGWAVWLPTAVAALPAAVLSSTLHILKYWKGSSLKADFTSPLVDSQPSQGAWDPAPMPRVNLSPRAADSSKPIWPPPGSAATTPGSDMEADAAKGPGVWPPPGAVSR